MHRLANTDEHTFRQVFRQGLVVGAAKIPNRSTAFASTTSIQRVAHVVR